jgi:hypothetical protein
MAKFYAQLDVKVAVWQRLDISFEADSEAHAKELIEKWEGVPEDRHVAFWNTETLYDTEERLTAKENNDQPVFEIQNLEKRN